MLLTSLVTTSELFTNFPFKQSSKYNGNRPPQLVAASKQILSRRPIRKNAAGSCIS